MSEVETAISMQTLYHNIVDRLIWLYWKLIGYC